MTKTDSKTDEDKDTESRTKTKPKAKEKSQTDRGKMPKTSTTKTNNCKIGSISIACGWWHTTKAPRYHCSKPPGVPWPRRVVQSPAGILPDFTQVSNDHKEAALRV